MSDKPSMKEQLEQELWNESMAELIAAGFTIDQASAVCSVTFQVSQYYAGEVEDVYKWLLP